jgi:hypothetical protein
MLTILVPVGSLAFATIEVFNAREARVSEQIAIEREHEARASERIARENEGEAILRAQASEEAITEITEALNPDMKRELGRNFKLSNREAVILEESIENDPKNVILKKDLLLHKTFKK